MNAATLALALGGALGPFLRRLASKGEEWKSRDTVIEVVIGSALGILLPVLPLDALANMVGITSPVPTLPPGWTPLQYGAGMTIVTYALGDVIRERILNRFMGKGPSNG